MENKIRRIIYFIVLIILSGVINGNLAYGIEKEQTPSGYIQSLNIPTADIEQFFKDNLPTSESIIYTKVPRGLVISMDSKIFFEDGEDEIKEEAKNILNTIAQILQYINIPCVIESSTANENFRKNCYNSNWELTMVRAEKIAQYLLDYTRQNSANCPDNQNLSDRIRAFGFGEIMPLDNNIPQQNNFNRRIDFVILNYQDNNFN